MKKNNENRFDVIIAGGGMIGVSMALAISSFGLKIGLVEKVERDENNQPSFDDRSTAISRSSQNMFEAMGIWEKIRQASTPIRAIHVSDKGRFGFSHISAKEEKVEALGYVVINRILGSVLLEELKSKSNITVFCPETIISIDEKEKFCELNLRSEDKSSSISIIKSKMLIVASGAKSGLHRMLGIGANEIKYSQDAIIGNVLTEIPIDNRAFERFYDSGSIAFLPIENNRSAFIWVLPDHQSQAMMNSSEVDFIESLQEEFGMRLGNLNKLGSRVLYPLTLTQAYRLKTKRSVLVGNAANGLHPIAAQGFNLGLRDVATLADCIFSEIREGNFDENIGKIMNDYAIWRKSDHQKLGYFTDGLVKIFGSKHSSIGVIRNLGMLGMDFIPGFRKLFVRHTMGLAGRLPRLSRGVPYQ